MMCAVSVQDGKPFQRIEAVGKNLFAFFGSPKGPLAVVHIHFGMAGVWAVFDSAREPVPPTTGTTRLCLEHGESGLVAHLSAMTVQLGDEEFYLKKKAGLGQDPLREDADADLLFEKVSKSGKKIGELLMDQSFFCGPGNIYRAEILFKAVCFGSNPTPQSLNPKPVPRRSPFQSGASSPSLFLLALSACVTRFRFRAYGLGFRV